MIANWEKGRGRSRKRDRSWAGHGRRDWSSDGKLHAARFRRDNLDSAISTMRSYCASRVGAVVRWLVCSSSSLSLLSLFVISLSLSLGVCESGNYLKVKQKRKWFFGSKSLFYSQSLRFFGKLYFTCTPKHAVGCKIFSENHLHPKQTQP